MKKPNPFFKVAESKPKWTAADHIAEAQKHAAPTSEWDECAMSNVDEMADPESVQLSIAHSLIAIAMQGQPKKLYVNKETGETETLESLIKEER